MLIFDRFPSLSEAESFASAAQEQTGDPSIIVNNLEEFEKYDVFPWELEYPAVLVPRLISVEEEEDIELLVVEFGGEFAGT